LRWICKPAWGERLERLGLSSRIVGFPSVILSRGLGGAGGGGGAGDAVILPRGLGGAGGAVALRMLGCAGGAVTLRMLGCAGSGLKLKVNPAPFMGEGETQLGGEW
jgi:hypothetical protein